MQQTSNLSEARRALLEQYLRGELSAKIASAEVPLLPINTQKEVAPESDQPRATLIQAGSTRGLAAKTPFFFLHGDWTGNAVFCYNLARGLGTDQPFYTLDTYDFEKLTVLPDLETIAAEQLKMIRAIQPEGPYQLGGFCNGALIVYEMARQLHTAGQTVDLLVLMDAIPPRYTRIRNTIERIGSFLHLSQEQQLACFLRLQHAFRMLTDHGKVEDYDFLKNFDSRITKLFPPLEALRKEFAATFIWATSQYKPGYYPGKVTLFWEEAEPIRSVWWQEMAQGKDSEVEVYTIPGSHKTCKTEHIGGMAERLAKCLQQVQTQRRQGKAALM